MAKLEELKKKLFSKNFAGRKRRVVRLPEAGELEAGNKPWLFGQEELKRLEAKKRRHHILMMISGFLMGIVVLAVAAFWLLQSGILLNFFKKEEAELSIIAPAEILAGDRVTYTVVVKNKSKVVMKEAELLFDYPRGSEIQMETGESASRQVLNVRVPLDNIPPESESSTDFTARIFGKEGDELFARAVLRYTEDNATSRLEARREHRLIITRVPLTLEFKGAEKVLSGESREYIIEYASNASAQFRDVALRVLIPDGFQIEKLGAEPAHKTNRELIWDLGNVSPGLSGSISMRGVLSGAPLDPKTFQYGLGVFNKTLKSWEPYIENFAISEIIAPQLEARVLLGGKRDINVAFGESVQGEITIKNNSNVPFRNIIVSADFEGPIDPSWLRGQNGAVIGSRAIQWKVSTEPKLQLLDVGEPRVLYFSFNILKANRAGNLKNATVKTYVRVTAEKDETIDFTPEGQDTIIAQVRALPYFSSKALYSGTVMPNTGPIPPKVGSETTYAIIWEIGSFGAELEDAKVRALLPPYMNWKNAIVPAAAAVIYNKVTNEIIWNIGRISAGDLDRASQKISFQLGFVPAPSQAGLTADILTSIIMRGTDAFTKNEIELSGRSLNTDLPDDFGIPANSGRVAE